jgi:DNA gyrase subunit A
MVNKSSLIERIAELARDGHLEGLSDLRDESDRQGMRIVLEMTKNANPEIVMRDLYKRTPMQTTFSINLLALVDGEPRTLTLKQALRVYVEHRLEVIKRRAQFDLEKAKARQHILEGYLVALKNLDEVIHLIRSASDVETARAKLMKRYKLTELQANAILDMQLRRLAALERKKIETEYKEVTALIKELTKLLKSPKLMRGVVAEELQKVKAAYADRRRTQIVNLKEGTKATRTLTASADLPQQTVWIGVTDEGLVSRTADDKQPRHSGNDAPRFLVKASTSDTVYFVSKLGKAAAVAAHLIPEAKKLSQGSAYFKVSPLTENDALAAVFALPANKTPFRRRDLHHHRHALRHGQEIAHQRTARSLVADVHAGQGQRRGSTRLGRLDRWKEKGNPARHLQRHGDPLQGGRRAPDGTRRRGRERHETGGEGPGRRHGDPARRRRYLPADG